MENFKYSVVATTYNDEKSIERYLIDMCKQTLSPAEIVIADGGSKDNTVSKIQEFAKKASVPIKVVQDGRLNIAEGYNAAIKSVSSEYIGISGIGNRYEADYFELLSKAFDDCKLAISYSPIRGYDSTPFSKKYNKHMLNGSEGSRLQIASNHGALVRKSVFEELGYFYENFVYAGEDGEFYWLVKNSGYKMVIIPNAKVYWETPETFKEFKKQVRAYTIANLQINSKREKRRSIKALFELFAFIIAIVLGIFCLFNKSTLWISIVCLLLITALLIKRRSNLNFFRLFRKYYGAYCAIKDRKYMSSEYAVKR